MIISNSSHVAMRRVGPANIEIAVGDKRIEMPLERWSPRQYSVEHMATLPPHLGVTPEQIASAKERLQGNFTGFSVTESTIDSEPKGGRVAIVLQPGSPVRAVIHTEGPDPAKATCQAFLETIPDVGDAAFMSVMEPIDGVIDLAP